LNNVAIAYRGLGQCEEVAAEMQRALSLVPKASRYHGMLANCWMLHHGETEKAIGLFTNEPLDFIRLTGLAIAYDKLGDRARAQQYLDQLVASDGDDASYQYAQIYAQWGETEKALDALDRAWEIGDPGTIIVNVDSHMDPLRDQPRFVSLMEKWWDPSKR
jgi:tetratricopeptide (TPR) repeat protein